MLWITGGGLLHAALRTFGNAQPAAFFAWQFEHVAWEGFHFEDLIFPLFVFIAGASLVFSLTRAMQERGRAATTRRVIGRALLLFIIGVYFSGGFANGVEKVRWLGVLQRIAIAYLGAGILFLWLKPRALIAVCITLLLGYWALLALVPVPEIGAGNFAEGKNLTNHLDRVYLPGRKYDGDHDPEGLLSNLPAIASCLLGVFAGLLLKSDTRPTRKLATLFLAGAALLALGWAWSPWFPVIKKLWTSSYVLVAAGWSALLLGAFYWIIDVRGCQSWARPFIWIGMNPITIYLAGNVIDQAKLAARFTGGNLQFFLNTAVHPGVGNLLTALVAMSFSVLLAWFLHRKKIFFRV